MEEVFHGYVPSGTVHPKGVAVEPIVLDSEDWQAKEWRTMQIEHFPASESCHEAVEMCPYCLGEHLEADWAPSKGYCVTCSHCGGSILLCDECLHAEDNPGARCDENADTGICFRDRKSH